MAPCILPTYLTAAWSWWDVTASKPPPNCPASGTNSLCCPFGLLPLKTCISLRFLFSHRVQAVHIIGMEVLPGQGFVLLFHLKLCTGSTAGYAAAMRDDFVGKPNTVFIQAGLNELECCSFGHVSHTPRALGASFPSVLCV